MARAAAAWRRCSPWRRVGVAAAAMVAMGAAAVGGGASSATTSAGTLPAGAVTAGPAALASASASADPRRSGIADASPETQAMQRDDTLNPAMLWVADGAALWQQPAGEAAKSCASCHGDAATAMRGVAARYPRFDERLQRPVTLAQRIAACRVDHQRAAPFATTAGAAGGQSPLLALETFVAHQSRGLEIVPDADPRSAPWRERGERLYRQRIGQLDLSCAQCHDERAGQRLGGAVIPQAHPTGYPIYRLEWQGVGSLTRRLRGCMTGVRAEPFAVDAPKWVELELYLNARAAGMVLETPGVRP